MQLLWLGILVQVRSEFTAALWRFYYFLFDSSQEIRNILHNKQIKVIQKPNIKAVIIFVYFAVCHLSIYEIHIILVMQILFDFYSVFCHFYAPIFEEFKKPFSILKRKNAVFYLVDVPKFVYAFLRFGILRNYQFFVFVIKP